MQFNHFLESLQKRLGKPLPGPDAQMKMASRSRLQWLREGMDATGARESGVLILLYPDMGSVFIVLILRPDYDGVHSGQVGLPGGKMETGDATLVETALRESHEELGISSQHIQILGTLTQLYIPPSNFLVLPVVGYIQQKPDFHPDRIEVKKIIELDIVQLLDNRCRITKEIEVSGHILSVPCYVIDGEVIWGATAMILSEFAEIVSGIGYRV